MRPWLRSASQADVFASAGRLEQSRSGAAQGADVRVALAPDGIVYVPDSQLAKRLSGINEIYHDFLRAHEMIDAALKQDEPLLVSALWHTAASLYARAFADAGSRRQTNLARDHLRGLDAQLLKLHDFIQHARQLSRSRGVQHS